MTDLRLAHAAPKDAHVRSIDTLEVIFKISERCNLECSYCYYFFGGDESYAERPALYNLDQTDALVAFVNKAATQYGIKKVKLVFHGGEPMMLQPRKFDRLCADIRDGLSSGDFELKLAMQTNGTLVTEGWLDILSRHGVAIGISMDGTKEQHDKFRIDKKGKGSFETIKRNVSLIKNGRHAEEYAELGVIVVLNLDHDLEAVMHTMIDEIGFSHINFLLPDISAEAPLSKQDETRYGELLIDMFLAKLHRPNLNMRIIDGLLACFQIEKYNDGTGASAQTRDVTLDPALLSSPIAAQNGHLINQIVVVHSNGDISIDDSLTVATDWRNAIPRLNMATHGFSEFMNLEAQKDLHKALTQSPAKCSACRWKRICHAGDLENRYKKENGFDNPTVYCEPLKMLYSYVEKTLTDNGYPKDLFESRLSGDISHASFCA